MSLSMLSLLIHEEDVPDAARAALRKAAELPDHTRRQHLELAAQLLNRDAHLDCEDARELVGL